MIVRKVRGENRIHPVKITSVQLYLAKTLGLTVEQYVKSYLSLIAKQRRWKWWGAKK
jgi:hypothetical protein